MLLSRERPARISEGAKPNVTITFGYLSVELNLTKYIYLGLKISFPYKVLFQHCGKIRKNNNNKLELVVTSLKLTHNSLNFLEIFYWDEIIPKFFCILELQLQTIIL